MTPNHPLGRPDQCFTEHARSVPVLAAAYPLLIEFSIDWIVVPGLTSSLRSQRWR